MKRACYLYWAACTEEGTIEFTRDVEYHHSRVWFCESHARDAAAWAATAVVMGRFPHYIKIEEIRDGLLE